MSTQQQQLLAKKFDRKKQEFNSKRTDVILHNFLFPSLQKHLLQEVREGLKQHPLFDVGDGSKLSYLGSWGKGKNQLRYSSRTGDAAAFPDHATLVWNEFHWENNWKVDRLPNCCEVRFYPSGINAGEAKPLSFDHPGLLISLGRWIEIRRFSYHHDDLFASGSCLFVHEKGTSLKLLRFEEGGHFAEGLVPQGVSVVLVLKEVIPEKQDES